MVTDLTTKVFDNDCGDEVLSVLRLSFHDAISISPSLGGGGADGSIITFAETETNFAANLGTDDGVNNLLPFLARNPNITTGDAIFLATAVGMTLCPGGPKLAVKIGRPPPKAAAPDGLVPNPFDTLDSIFARMNDAGGFTPNDVVSLIASHSTAGADHVDPTIPGTPFDSTPGVFDTQVFIEVQLRGTIFPGSNNTRATPGEVMSPLAGEMRLQSDLLFARDSRTDCQWQSFANNHALMVSSFEAAFARLAVLGQNQADLIDCSDVIPTPPPLPASASPHLPAGFSMGQIEQACATAAFPSLTAQPGPVTTVASIPQS
jgi:hypothetical protein